jgi:hypothetical protein
MLVLLPPCNALSINAHSDHNALDAQNMRCHVTKAASLTNILEYSQRRQYRQTWKTMDRGRNRILLAFTRRERRVNINRNYASGDVIFSISLLIVVHLLYVRRMF